MATQTKHGTHVTTDHDEIRGWAEERGAKLARVRGTGSKDDLGVLRLDFPGYTGEDTLEEISWDDWFRKFDEEGLAFIYQEVTAGGEKSNFNKIVSRETVDEADHERKPARNQESTAGKSSKKRASAKHG